jgi:hypothetical protein
MTEREREILRQIADSTSEFYDSMKILQRAVNVMTAIRSANAAGRCVSHWLDELDRLTAVLDKMRKVA